MKHYLKKTRDKSDECLKCEICKIDCLKKHKGEIRPECEYHDVLKKEEYENEKYTYYWYYFRTGYRPDLKAHFCLEHNMYHCLTHQQHCKEVYGSSVMDWKPPAPKEIRDAQAQKVKGWDAEACRMQTWSDQMDFGIIKCAECKKTVCKCYPDDFREYEGGRKKTRADELIEEAEELGRRKNEYELAEEIMLDHYQKTGYSLNRGEVLKKLRNGDIKINGEDR